MQILERNFRCRSGETDIIARDGDYLVFVEVKYRRNSDKGGPFAAVGVQKQRKICRVADYYRYTRHVAGNQKIRYDVVAILDDSVRLLKNAFYHISAVGSW